MKAGSGGLRGLVPATYAFAGRMHRCHARDQAVGASRGGSLFLARLAARFSRGSDRVAPWMLHQSVSGDEQSVARVAPGACPGSSIV